MEFITAALSLIRREITRLFANHGPSASPYVIAETVPGTVTGSINASDPEADPLSYTVVEGPEAGSVSVGRTARSPMWRTRSWPPPAARILLWWRCATPVSLFGGPVTTLAPVTVVVSGTESGPGACWAVQVGRQPRR